jgi:nucleoside-diphosphate-sugar epimerase
MKVKTAALKAFPNAATHLELIPLELTDEADAFEKAVQGVEWVMHVASPVIMHINDENEIIRPAVEGTISMFRAAHKTSSVQKVIFTSSIDSIMQGHPPS